MLVSVKSPKLYVLSPWSCENVKALLDFLPLSCALLPRFPASLICTKSIEMPLAEKEITERISSPLCHSTISFSLKCVPLKYWLLGKLSDAFKQGFLFFCFLIQILKIFTINVLVCQRATVSHLGIKSPLLKN